MAFRFYIDGQLTDQPTNDMELVTSLKRDSDLGGFTMNQDISLIYAANNAPEAGTISGFTYLKSLFDAGTCNESEVVIYDDATTFRIYTGIISVPAISISEQEMILTTEIDDNSFYSYIKNNRNVKFNLYSNRTKNNQLITPCQVYEVDMFNSLTGVYGSSIGVLYRGFRLYDILRYIVPAISDNKVTFESNYLQNDNQLFLFDGSALVNNDTDPNVFVSFDEIIVELFKLKNISFYINQTDPDNPILRLEDANWFFAENTVMSFDDLYKVETSIKNEKIYGTISVGADYNPGGTDPVYTFNAGTSYFGWKKEIYTPYGQCNTDNELNLVNQWAIASNAINYQLVGAATTDLDTIFCVECDNVDTSAFTATAVDYDIYGSGVKRFYNVGLNNVEKINLHSGNFQSALTNTAEAGDDIFRASLGQDELLIDLNPGGTGNNYTVLPIVFGDEFGGGNYDPGNNYDNVLGMYTVGIPGDYSFQLNMNVELMNCKYCPITSSPPPQVANVNLSPSSIVISDAAWGIENRLNIIAYTDATLTTVITSSQKLTRTYTDGFYLWQLSLVANLPTGAVVVASSFTKSLQWSPALFGSTPLEYVLPIPYLIFANCSYAPLEGNRTLIAAEDSTFECNGTPDGGLVLGSPDLNGYKVRLHEFEYDITATQFNDILTNPIGQFTFEKDGIIRTGWIEELSHNHQTGRTKVKLISNDATS